MIILNEKDVYKLWSKLHNRMINGMRLDRFIEMESLKKKLTDGHRVYFGITRQRDLLIIRYAVQKSQNEDEYIIKKL